MEQEYGNESKSQLTVLPEECCFEESFDHMSTVKKPEANADKES